jgi:hypothetical protein
MEAQGFGTEATPLRLREGSLGEGWNEGEELR